MSKRINVILPEETLRVMDRLAKPRERSRFISKAIHYYVEEVGRTHIREQLKEGAITRAERDLEIAADWFDLEQEVWPTDHQRNRK
ncbi:MAG: hypothetical protein ACREON_09615 [Gemmatimonadaceae bacterium]